MRAPPSAPGFLLVIVGASALGCGAGTREVGRATTTSSAEEGRRRPAASRTIDNAGFVDNAGRTTSETARTQMSGMRASEVGSERPTGTPASGATIPTVGAGSGGGAADGEGAGAASSVRAAGPAVTTSGAPDETVVARVTRARCDHETTCGRVAPARGNAALPRGAEPPHASQDACMMHERARTHDDMARAACANGFDAVQLANCLTAIRHLDCGARATALDDVQACQSSALCAPR